MDIKLKKINRKSPEISYIRRLYSVAFPKDEQAPFFILAAKSARKNVDWWAIIDGDNCVGFFYTVLYKEDLVYIFYFAIDENVRGRGYGSAALTALKREYDGKRLFLAMEEMDENADNYEQRLNRKKFYEFNGFCDMGTKLIEGTVIYDVLSIGGNVAKDEYHNLMMSWLGWYRLFVRTEFLD